MGPPSRDPQRVPDASCPNQFVIDSCTRVQGKEWSDQSEGVLRSLLLFREFTWLRQEDSITLALHKNMASQCIERGVVHRCSQWLGGHQGANRFRMSPKCAKGATEDVALEDGAIVGQAREVSASFGIETVSHQEQVWIRRRKSLPVHLMSYAGARYPEAKHDPR